MLFKQRFWVGLADGSITLAFRRWRRPGVRAGGTLHIPTGVLAIDAVGRVDAAGISEPDARAAGFSSRAELLAELAARDDGDLYRIDFHFAGADPRIQLRDTGALPPAGLAELNRRLARLDAAGRHGPWTAAVLRLIDERPGTRAAELAAELGRDTASFKLDVRKLKNLGLTESLGTGYRISPRGRAFLERTSSPSSSAGAETDPLWATPLAVLTRYGEDGDAYQAGASVYQFRQPAIDWYGRALDNLDWAGDEAVLDAGCGRGAYLPHIAGRLGPAGRLLGLDFSRFAAQQAKLRTPSAGVLTGDVQSLPFADGSFDLVLSAHMLYHVPDIRAAVAEFRRVLQADGVLAIIVGSASDQRELDDLFVAAGGAFPLQRYSDRFTSDNAHQYLDGIFTRIERRDVHPELVITDADALVSHFASQRTIAEAALRPDVTWEGFSREVRRIAAGRILRDGAFRVSEEISILLCR